jgi:drug/metabolite transporter (DMT)-like permease
MQPVARKIPAAVVIGLIAAVALDTVIQVAWKRAVAEVPGDASFATVARAAGTSPFFYAAMAAFTAQFFNWLRVLKRADLSFAQPFTALSYVTVLAISGRALHETISAPKITGVALIFIGVFFISRTPFRTADGAGTR